MDAFDGVELVFHQSYSRPKPNRIVRIKSGNYSSKSIFQVFFTKNKIHTLSNLAAPIQSLSAIEVPPSAGSYGFPMDGLGLENRFIIWYISKELFLHSIYSFHKSRLF